AFELDPYAKPAGDRDEPLVTMLAKKYRTSESAAQAMIDRMTSAGAAEGMDFRFDRVRRGNTLDAHRLLAMARESGRQDPLKDRLLQAYFTDGEDVGDSETLTQHAEAVGLSADEVRDMLASDVYVEDVRQDEARAAALGITGVPFFVFGGRFGVSGAQSPEALRSVLERASEPQSIDDIDTGEICAI
ncbi:MAG: DsbA family oxidoreductase, partial [Myxococcota bacterium]